MCVGSLVPEIKIMIDLAVGLVSVSGSGYYLNLFVVITQSCIWCPVVNVSVETSGQS